MKRRLLFSALACFLAAFGATELAEAGFPGLNGKIVFGSSRDGDREIYSMNPDGTEQTRLTSIAGEDSRPVLSPDGTRIVYQRVGEPHLGNFEIYVMNADGTGQKRLTENATEDSLPVWSPDGTKIAFNSRRLDPNADIMVMDADGSNVVNLTNAVAPAAEDASPAWSPNGKKIAFHSRRDAPAGNIEIYVMNADGSSQTRLTENTAFDAFPFWSPDGTKLSFTSMRDGNFEIYSMDADGSNQVNLTKNAGFDERSAWSPDGTKIAFNTSRDGNFEIYSMNADGSNQVNLTNSPALEALGEWGRAFPSPPPSPASSPSPDVTAPKTVLLRHPKKKTSNTQAKLAFRADEAGSTFACRLTGKRARKALKKPKPCASPVTYRKLEPGRYKFQVAATDIAGNVDATPAVFSWQIVP